MRKYLSCVGECMTKYYREFLYIIFVILVACIAKDAVAQEALSISGRIVDLPATYTEFVAFDKERNDYSAFRVNVKQSITGINTDITRVKEFSGYNDWHATDLQAYELNGDGYTDLVTITTGASFLLVHLSQADGTYLTSSINWTGGRGAFLGFSVADFNNDSFLDLLIRRQAFSSSATDPQIGIFTNNGQGQFSLAYEGSIAPGSTLPGVGDALDVDANGWVDVALLGFRIDTKTFQGVSFLGILPNKSKSSAVISFDTASSNELGRQALSQMSLASKYRGGDVNADGLKEFLQRVTVGGQLSWQLIGRATVGADFELLQTFPASADSRFSDAQFADVDMDGGDDVVGVYTDPNGACHGFVRHDLAYSGQDVLQSSSRSYESYKQYDFSLSYCPTSSWGLRDVTKDGFVDLVGSDGDGRILVYRNNGQYGFEFLFRSEDSISGAPQAFGYFSSVDLKRGAVVTNGMQRAFVDSTGRFALANMSAGIHALSVFAGGYSATSSSGSFVFDLSNGNIGGLTFWLSNSGDDVVDETDTDPIASDAIVEDGLAIGEQESDLPPVFDDDVIDDSAQEGKDIVVDAVDSDDVSEDNALSNTTVLFGSWNGFLSMTNVLEVVNKGHAALDANVKVFGANGDVLASVVIHLLPYQQRDIVLNELSDMLKETYGIVQVSAGGVIDGRISLYGASLNGEGTQFAYSNSLSKGEVQTVSVPFNTIYPGKQSGVVFNWLSISNCEPEEQSFLVRTYDIQGKLLFERNIRIAAFGRVDIDGGHELVGENQVGLHVIEPITSSPDISNEKSFLAHVSRYGMSSRGETKFAAMLPASLGGSEVLYAPTVKARDGVYTWVEVLNTKSESVDVMVDIVSSQGSLVDSKHFVLAPYAQVHVNIDDGNVYDGRANVESGRYVRIRSVGKTESVAGVLAYSMSYVLDGNNDVEQSYAVALSNHTSSHVVGSYNSYLDTENFLYIVNPTNVDADLSVWVTRLNGRTTKRSYTVPNGEMLQIEINAPQNFSVNSNSYGVVTVSYNDASLKGIGVLSHIVRQSSSGFVNITELR